MTGPLWLVLLGCRSPDDRSIGKIEVLADPDHPTVLHVSWDWDGPADHHVEVWVDGDKHPDTPTSTESRVDVLGIHAGASVELVAFTTEPHTQFQSRRFTLQVDDAPADLARLEVPPYDPAMIDPGRYLLTSYTHDGIGWITIVDREGRPVWWRRVEEELSAVTSRGGADGHTVVAGQYHRGQTEDLAKITHLPLRGGPEHTTRTPMAHHDFAELDDGTVAFLAMDIRDLDIDGEISPVRGDLLLETVTFATDDDPTLTLFSTLDDLDRDPWFPCSHAEELSPTPDGPAHDFSHSNSLVPSTDQTAYFVNARYLDALWRIDRASGALQWQLGGEDNDFEVTEGELWAHGHMTQVFDDGVVMFDNATHRDPAVSAVVEYVWDEAALTVREVFRYESPDGWEVGALGDARRLPNGHYLVSWGEKGAIQEITADGQIVWQATGPTTTLVSRLSLFTDLYDLRSALR